MLSPICFFVGEEQVQCPTKDHTRAIPSDHEENSASGQQNKCYPQMLWHSEHLVRLHLSPQLYFPKFLKILPPPHRRVSVDVPSSFFAYLLIIISIAAHITSSGKAPHTRVNDSFTY